MEELIYPLSIILMLACMAGAVWLIFLARTLVRCLVTTIGLLAAACMIIPIVTFAARVLYWLIVAVLLLGLAALFV
ncbi:MAG: hypothetical protein IKD69_04190 [Solobacterium sp.]|nr:hypothetical protein [Solobacterium sp.]